MCKTEVIIRKLHGVMVSIKGVNNVKLLGQTIVESSVNNKTMKNLHMHFLMYHFSKIVSWSCLAFNHRDEQNLI